MTEGQSYDVFLSYSMRDKEWVSAFADSLRTADVRAWFDVSSLTPGDRWQDKIQEALRASKTLIVILSSHSIDSPWIFFELGAAIADKKRIIPIVTEDIGIERIPILLRQFQFLRETSPAKAGEYVAKLLKMSTTSV